MRHGYLEDKTMNILCSICNQEKDCRPYLNGGKMVCFQCMSENPQTEEEAKNNFKILLEQHERKGFSTLLTDDGPLPIILPKQ